MNVDDLKVQEKLIAYHSGNISNETDILEIQSSAQAVTWLQEFRFLRILASDCRVETEHEDISQTDIRKFCLEKLRPTEMLKIERALTYNSALFKEYIALKLELNCDKKTNIPSTLDANVKSMLFELGKNKNSDTLHAVLKNPTWLNSAMQRLYVSLRPRKIALASGFALASVVALVGTKNIGLWGQPTFSPLIVQNFDLNSLPQELQRQIRLKNATISNNNSLETIHLNLSPKTKKLLISFSESPDQETASSLIQSINMSIELLPKRTKEKVGKARFRIENIQSIQIEPQLFQRLRLDADSDISATVSLVTAPDPSQKQSLNSAMPKPTINVLYFTD